MLAFCVNLPSLGEAKLKHRENPRLLGTDKEHIMLQPEDPWYQVSKLHICILLLLSIIVF
jgi:protein transport protein SEC24